MVATAAFLNVIREPEMWERAKKISKAMLDGQIWLPEVGKSTHYHAYWVRPSWVAEMKKMYKFGVHTFYRPRAWGDGGEEPSWGTPAQTAALSARRWGCATSESRRSAIQRAPAAPFAAAPIRCTELGGEVVSTTSISSWRTIRTAAGIAVRFQLTFSSGTSRRRPSRRARFV